MDIHEAIATPQIHFRGWFLGSIIMLGGVVLPFLYMSMKNANSGSSLIDVFKRK